MVSGQCTWYQKESVPPPLVALFTAAELGAALGRGRAVHVALARGSLARRLVLEAQRLAGFGPEGGLTLPDAAGPA